MYQSLLLAALFAVATAKTDLSGCTSSDTIAYGGASVLWYVPGTGEICEFLDCGGGRAPPKTTVPGCAGYKGTASYSPSYLAGFGGAAVTEASSSAFVEATTTSPPVNSATASSSAPGVASVTATFPVSDVTLLTGSSSNSVTPTFSAPIRPSSTDAPGSQASESQASESGSQDSGSSSTKTTPSSSTSTSGSAATPSDSGNAAVANSINKVSGGVGIFAAAFAFLM